jgi:VWFA-related protein
VINRALLTTIVCTAALFAALGAQTAPVLHILTPLADDVLSGPTRFAAEVQPEQTLVQRVDFFLDGTLACRALKRPFECTFDAGRRSAASSVRVVAVLPNDQSLVETIRTKAPHLVLTAGTDAVLVTVHVLDSHGRYVSGLNLSQFRLLEDGTPQEIQSLASEDAPSSVFLTLDMSGSMVPALTDLRQAAGGFLRALRPTDDVTVAAFNSSLFVLAPPGTPLDARLASLDRLSPAGRTALYDVVIQATNRLATDHGRRAIVAFTDGDDDASVASLDSVRTSLESSDVVLYLIARGEAARNERLRAALSAVATATGGQAFFGPNMSRLSDHFDQIRDELGSGYLLGYVPTKPLGDGAWRKLTVTIANADRNLRVRAREGYLAVRR